MEIILGKTAGFCYGVKRAVDGTKEILKQNKEKITYCLGEIVHNKDVIDSLEKQGLKFIDNISEAKGTTIIRAHGIEKSIYEKAEKSNINIKDFTCPNVIKIHNIAEEYAKKGYYIFLTGSKKHPENIGTISFCGNKYSIIEKEDDIFEAIKKLENSKINKLLLISQTTYSLEKFEKTKGIIQNSISENIEFVVKNTICASTKIRQNETEKIAKQVDCIIIIGGKNSSNTKKLFEIAEKNCKNAICIENATELDIEMIKGVKKLGIMAGASTPKQSIDDVLNKINS